MSTAGVEELRWLEDVLKTRFEITAEILGHNEEDKEQIQVLNRLISVSGDGCLHETEVRRSEVITKELAFGKFRKSLSTPVAEGESESEGLVDHERLKKYQSVAWPPRRAPPPHPSHSSPGLLGGAAACRYGPPPAVVHGAGRRGCAPRRPRQYLVAVLGAAPPVRLSRSLLRRPPAMPASSAEPFGL